MFTIALALPLLAASDAAAQGALKLGHIDSRAILAQAPGRVAVDSAIARRLAPMQARMNVMQDSLRTMIAAFQKDEATLTPALRQQRGEAIQRNQQRWEAQADSIDRRAAMVRDSLSRPLIELFNQVLNDLRNDEGYAYIFDIGSQAQAILAVDKNLDLSDKVLSRMRAASASRAASPPKPTVGPAATSGTSVTRPPPGR
jgi:outer membrane protein